MPLNCLSLHPSFIPTKPISLINLNFRKLNVGPTRLPRISTSTCSCSLNVGFEDIAAVAQNKVLIAAGVCTAIGQLSKPITGVLLYGRSFDVKAVFQAGGFPSTHSSAVVATATCLALERGFSDPIVGMAAVYAGLIMYDAQGVRREVGIHAKTLNSLLLDYQTKSVTNEGKDIVDSVQEITSIMKSESSNTLEGPGTSRNEQNATQCPELMSQRSTTERDLTGRTRLLPLKESIGHTEVEVIAGAFLGFLVSLTLNIVM